jgi:lysophospholipase L1-like esterase
MQGTGTLRRLVRAVVGTVIAIDLAVAAAALGPAGAVHAAASAPPVRILVLGDSISAPEAWQGALGQLLDAAKVPHDIHTAAVAGVPCVHWVAPLPNLVSSYKPDLVVLECGTNDDPGATTYGEPTTGWALRSIIETVHAARPSKPIPVVVSLDQYSDPLLAPGWLWDANEPRTNDLLWSNLQRYLPPNHTGWIAGVADLQRIPATATYIDAGGIHPTAKGQQDIARLVYDAAAATMRWAGSTAPEPCDLYGHRPGYPRPTYRPC